MIDLRDAQLLDFTPESIASDPEIVALSAAIDPQQQAVSAAIVQALILPRISQLDEPVLDAIAWGFKLDRLRVWDIADLAAKRTILGDILYMLRRSGTPIALRRALALFHWNSSIVEWFTEAATNQTYRIVIAQNGGNELSLEQLRALEELIYRFGRASAQLSGIAITTWNVDNPIRTALGASDPVAVTFRVGDGTGTPTVGWTQLVHQTGSFAITGVNVNPSGTHVQVTIPGGTGGYTIREAALFNAGGELLVHGTVVPVYKTTSSDPFQIPLTLKLVTA